MGGSSNMEAIGSSTGGVIKSKPGDIDDLLSSKKDIIPSFGMDEPDDDYVSKKKSTLGGKKVMTLGSKKKKA